MGIQKTESHIVICTLPFNRINGLILLYITNMNFTWRNVIIYGHSVDDSLKAWEAITGQPQLQCYYHRSLQDIFNLCFESGFIIDGFYEECYGVDEKPDVIIVRARKYKK